ncbi:MAG TPA: preprotein translocase subunit SecG [Bradyrhizobium sp.]|nr:preprotein translocase subunit SecG [Bradyrhizobium sp.]
MQSVIIVIHLMIVLAMVGLILLQKSEGGGLGMGSGGGGGFMSSRGTTNVLTRATAILAAVFFTTSLILSMLAGFDRKPRSVLTPTGQPSPSAPVSPGSPLGGPGGGVLDQLRGPPQSPAPPAGPQVPRSQ